MKEKTDLTFSILLSSLSERWKLIVIITLFSLTTGLAYSLFLNNRYVAATTFIPRTSSSSSIGGGNLGGLASLAGINLGGMGNEEEIPPSIYPRLVKSISFREEILDRDLSPFYSGSLRDYINEEERIKESTPIVEELEVDGTFFRITESDYDRYEYLNDNLKVTPNDKEGFVSVSFECENPNISAKVVDITRTKLEREVINFRLSKSKQELDFIMERYKDIQVEFLKKQREFTTFQDQNSVISTSKASTQLDNLRTEYELISSVFQELGKQVETAKIQVNKETPVFTIIEEVSIPYKKTFPRRGVIVAGFTFLGLLGSFIYILMPFFVKRAD